MFIISEIKKNKIATEVEYEYSRSSGPGGQKVNKTETQAGLRFLFLQSLAFTPEQKQRIAEKLKSRINKNNELYLQSDQFRTQLQNKKYCFELLISLLEKALTVPKSRRKTKPTRGSIEKRITEKKKQGEKKKHRQRID
jgi:ribosome-associated protein